MGVVRLDLVLVRSLATLVVVLAVTLSGWWPASSVSSPAAAASAAEMPIGATLKVLAGLVEVELAQSSAFVAALDGQMLNQGDVVRTGPGGLALVTFFDGSETQLGAESTVQIERVEATPAPQIAFLQTAGVTMNHVVPMPPGGSFQTDTPAATGLVRGTSYVVVVGDASATSVILLTDRDGHVGRVDVAASSSGPGGSGSGGSAPVRLTRAGDAAGSDGVQTSAAHVAAARLQALEAGANARGVLDAARDAEQHAHVVAAALAGLDAPDALEPAPAPVATPHADSDRFEETGRPTPAAHVAESRPVTMVSVPPSAGSATTAAPSKQKDSQPQSGQSGQSDMSGKPAAVVAAVVAAVSRTVPAVSAPAASSGDKPAKADKQDKLNKP